MNHGDGADRFIVRQNFTVSVYNPSSRRLYASLSFMKLSGLERIIFGLEHHQIDQPSRKPKKRQRAQEKYGHRLAPVIGSVVHLIIHIGKPHKKVLI